MMNFSTWPITGDVLFCWFPDMNVCLHLVTKFAELYDKEVNDLRRVDLLDKTPYNAFTNVHVGIVSLSKIY